MARRGAVVVRATVTGRAVAVGREVVVGRAAVVGREVVVGRAAVVGRAVVVGRAIVVDPAPMHRVSTQIHRSAKRKDLSREGIFNSFSALVSVLYHFEDSIWAKILESKWVSFQN